MRKSMRLFAATAASLALLTTTACGKSDSADSGLTPFPMAIFGGETYALDHIALEKGFFADNGLAVEAIKPSAGGGAANTLFIGGDIKTWPGNPSIPLVNVTGGKPITLVGGIENWIPIALQVADPSALSNSGDFATRVRALEGKTIGITGPGSLVETALLAALDFAGVAADDVTILGIGDSASALGQLKAGRIDGYVTFSRTDSLLLQQEAGASEYLDFSGPSAPAELASLSLWSFPFLPDYIAAEPEAVEGYVAAIKQAHAWSAENLSEAAEIVSKTAYQGKYADLVQTGLQASLESSAGDDFRIDESVYTHLIELLAGRGSLPADAPTNPAFSFATVVG